MRAPLSRLSRVRPSRTTSCESSSRALLCFPDLIRVLRPPREADPLALLCERLLRGRLEVLPDDHELAAGVEIDDEARDHADVDDLAHGPGLSFARPVVAHPNLFRPDGDAPAIALQ